jgi:hypothetical protein
MNQLTIRGFSPELEKALRRTTKRRGISLNKAALLLLRQGAGLRAPEEDPLVIGDSLDVYFGSMSGEDAEAVTQAVKTLDRTRDEEFWG